MSDNAAAQPSTTRVPWLSVTFLAGLVLLVETVLFHVLSYVHDYYVGTLAISCAVLGIGLGAAAASRVRSASPALFSWTCLLTTLCIYVSFAVLLRYPVPWLATFVAAPCFFFPVMFIAAVFRDHSSERVYLYDMAGAFLGVVATVALYALLRSEHILALVLTALPALGLLAAVSYAPARRLVPIGLNIALLGGGVYVAAQQFRSDAFNLHQLVNAKHSALDPRKVFVLYPNGLDRTYDNLRGRIDVLQPARSRDSLVAYHGMVNDHFTPNVARDYRSHYEPQKIEWPTKDCRVLYGIVPEPRVFVVGSAAQGIVKTLKKITPPENITPIEINPAILTIMQQDYYEQSGRAYDGLEPRVANAIAALKASEESYDMITLINTHSTKSIADRGAPDYLHTLETYGLYFEHLTEDGYLLFEERPTSREGELGLYRMINTLWHALAQRGVEDPSRHFLIWEWQGRSHPRIEKNHYKYYVSMVVTKNPIEGPRRHAIVRWIDRCALLRRAPLRIAYMNDYTQTDEYGQLFTMIRNGSFEPLKTERFDERLVTDDRPFAAVSTRSHPVLARLVLITSGVIAALWLVLSIHLGRRAPATIWPLNAFNVLIGLAYLFVEILYLQVYQNVFFGAAATFILILGLLLLSSGVGARIGGRVPLYLAAVLLVPVVFAGTQAPTWLLHAGLPLRAVQLVSVALIVGTGMLMGLFFPRGLQVAKEKGLQAFVPQLFAINSLAGSLAVAVALWCGITVGYSVTVVIALMLFVGAELLLNGARQAAALPRALRQRRAAYAVVGGAAALVLLVQFPTAGRAAPSRPAAPVEQQATLASDTQSLPTAAEAFTTLRPEVVDESLRRGRQFLLANQTSKGNFVYARDFLTGQVATSDNQVRQAGVLWSLALIHHDNPTPETAAAVQRGLAFFNKYTRRTPEGYAYIAYPNDDRGKTGTVALVTLAMIDYLRAEADPAIRAKLLAPLKAHLDFLMSLRREDGLLHGSYASDTGRPFGKASPYSDGEALLAFVKAAKYIDHHYLRWDALEMAEQMYQQHVVAALAKDPDSDETKGFYQWGSMAFYEIYTSRWPGTGHYAERVIDLAYWMIDVHETLRRTKNTGYAYEGIVHAWELARRRSNVRAQERFAAVIDIGLGKLTTWQVGGPLADQNPFLVRHAPPPPECVGGVMNRKDDPILRIDVTQHQMHALILTRRFLLRPRPVQTEARG